MKDDKARTLVLIFGLPCISYSPRILAPVGRNEIVRAVGTILAWIRMWFVTCDGGEMLKIWVSLDDKIVEEDEDNGEA